MPCKALAGILQVILPLVVLYRLPIVSGLPKLPDESLSWTVNTLSLLKPPLAVNERFIVKPAQIGEVTLPVVTVWASIAVVKKNNSGVRNWIFIKRGFGC